MCGDSYIESDEACLRIIRTHFLPISYIRFFSQNKFKRNHILIHISRRNRNGIINPYAFSVNTNEYGKCDKRDTRTDHDPL